MFKRTPAHEDYPASEAYTGPIDETARQGEVEGLPLEHHVSVYHSGRSDVEPHKHEEPVVELVKEKSDKIGKIVGMFKRTPAHDDYPASEAYTGPIDETARQGEVEGLPLEHHVSVYHSGRSDVEPHKHEEPVVELVKEKSDKIGKIVGMFKRTPAHDDYPASEAYTGPIDETARQGEVEGLPLEHHVSVYHSGRSDVEPHKHEEPVVELVKEKSDKIGKIVGMFKRTPAHEDYPASEAYTGPIDETARQGEVEGLPLEHHVSVYHSGRSDVEPHKHEEPVAEPVKEKSDTIGKIVGMFKRTPAHEDYPASEAYTGPIDETARQGEVEGLPLEHHVSVYHSGRSDVEPHKHEEPVAEPVKEKSDTIGKIVGMFKRTPAHEDYPASEAYTGPIDETARQGEVEGLPLEHHVSVYHSGRSDVEPHKHEEPVAEPVKEKSDTIGKIVGMFKRTPAHEDYPASEAYTGPIDETARQGEVEGLPLEHHVSVYHSGRSDVEPHKHEEPVVELVKEKSDKIGKIVGMFKRTPAHEDYPASEAYTGPIDETARQGEVEGLPLEHHVSVYHSGRSDVEPHKHEEPVAEPVKEKSDTIGKIVGMFKRTPAHEDYPASEAYTGPIDETARQGEVEGLPLEHHVSVYHSGRSDVEPHKHEEPVVEPVKEKSDKIAKIVGMFKRTPAHEDYPASEAYTGPIDETARQGEVEGLPLEHHVSVYHSGRSDVEPHKHEEPVAEPVKEKSDTIGKIVGMFKRTPAHDDYPASEAYTGPIDETARQGEVEGLPLEHHVSVYHSGRSDVEPHKHEEPVAEPVKEKSDTIGKIVGMFKRTPAHEDYPASEAYTGPIDETARQGEVEGLPLEHHVSVYHSGRSDVEPHKHEEPVAEPVKEKSDTIGKIVGMFKRTPAHEDYPASEAYTGPIDETARQGEVEGLPLEHHVSVYHSGRSDVVPHKHEEPVVEPVKEKSDTIGKIVGMFKRTPAHEDYPASEAYTGPIDETARQGEVEGLPLEHHVSVYHSGRSDVVPHKHEEPVVEPVKEKSDKIAKIVGMFKRTPAHEDYPASEAYTGPIDETARQGEVEGLPLEHHVSVYHSGRSDVEPHKHEEPVAEPVKEKSDTIGKIVGMFKRTPAHDDYPASEAYTGPIDETARQGEVEGLPLEHHVSVYHSGRSDVEPHKHEEPVVELVKEKSDKIGKIVGMFKRTPAHEDYPASEAYTGPIDETARQGEVEGLPLEHHVSVYHSGRSDVEPHKHEEPVVELVKEKSDKIGKIVGMFKRTPAHEDYPASVAYTGPIDETARQGEVEGLPFEHHVSVYHSGRSDVEPHKHEEPVAEPVKEKSDTIGKIVGMFKRTPAHDDYPASEAYTGPIDETARQGEVEGLPLEHHVSVYHSGRSDVVPHKHEEPVVEPVKEKSDKIDKIVGMFKRTPAHEDYPASEAYTGPIDETARQGEVEGLPLEHHVSVYHSGRSDVEPHKHEEPVAEPVKEKSDTIGKIVGMFKRTPAHEDYPASEAYTGPIDETARQGEVEGLPLEHHVSVYHSGRSDVEPHKHEEPVAEPVKEKSDTIGKIVGMFKRTPAHEDYPASEAYTGPIDETARQGEVEGLPLEHHVSVYHSGRSDVVPHKHEEPVVEPVKEKSDKIGKIVGMFKRTPAHEDYPASEAYTGPIDETARQGEVEGLPLEHHVSVYHSGRSDVEPHKHEEPVVEPVKEKSDTIGKIVGMFKRTPAHEDYPASEAYTGPIDETARQGEVEGLPLEHHVSVYHSGRSDVVPHKHEEPVAEPVKEKSDTIGKIVGMFKRTPAHEDYPASVAYTGPIDETARQGEVEGLPLEHHVSVYHSGRSDVEPHKHEEPVAEPVKEKSDTIGKIVGMFKRTPAHDDYPASEAYTGPIDETARQGEVEGLPLENHVSVYHSGRSDVEPHKHEEPVVEPVKEKSDKIGKIVGMFKRTPAHEDYPASVAYTGPIDETARQGEVEGLPFEHHVSVYHSGRSDVEPHKHEEPVAEPVKEKSDTIGKIVGMFKRTPAHDDYPASEAYTGPIDETARQGEVEGLPLEHHVSVYHSGRSDVVPHKHEEPVVEPVKEKSDKIDKIVGMFKRTPAHEDYPASVAYTGPIDETARQGEVEGLPLEHHVSVYHSGRSDVVPHKHEEPVAEPVKEKSDTIGKIVGMFKRTPAHEDYPASVAYTGPIDETARQGEVEGLPLEHHVSVYHSGRSDVEPHKHEEPVAEPVKEKSDTIGKIVGMFKRTPAHDDYPASEAYTGPIDETARQGEVEGLPFEHHVSVYHSGRSDVEPHKHEEPVAEPVKEKSDTIGKIVGMFKRTPAHDDYPASEAYTGPIDETARQGEVEGLPLENHVSVYHSGRSDVEPHKHEEPVVEPVKEKSDKIGKIVGMFKRTPAHEDYPASVAYTGPIDETARQGEVEGLPFEHHVSVYHSGRSDVEPHKHEEPVAEPVKEKSDTIGKIVGMFKRTPAHDDYPASEAYTGPIDETARQGEVEGLPLEHHVSVYHSGRSDVVPHKHEEPVVEPVKEKSDKIDKIVGMFKRTPAHEDYPASVAYTGPIDETARQGEVEGLPLEHHVSVYHSGRSDVEPHKHEEPVAEPVKEKSDTIGKIVGMFKRTPAHDDYPASEAYTGPIDETARQGEVEGLPLENHVSVYHSGRSDVEPHKHEEPVVEPVKEKSDKIGKIVGMFKRTPAHEDYPASVAYTGPIDETARQGEVEGLPFEHHVSVYHSGRSDVEPHKHEEPVAEPVKEKSDTIGKIVGMFKRTPAHDDYPASEAYTGPIDETARQGEVEGLPLEHHVSVYHSGRSDVVPHKHEEPVVEPVKEKSDKIDKIVGMFKRTPAHEDYPASVAYTGPIDETARQGEVEGLPLEHHVSVYHSGRSDVVPHKHEEPVAEPVKEKSDTIGKIVGMFKRTPAHEDYPASVAYTGPIDETARQGEVEGLPLEHHVSVYHSGRSDVEPHKHEEPVAEPVKEKSDTIGKIVGMFKRTPAHDDYPASEAYTGPIDETARQGEVEGLPLENHVSVYHSGRSDVEPHKHEEPVVEPVKEKSDKIGKIVGMFKRTPAHEDYPASVAYTGPIDETARQGEVEGLPFEHHVSVYHSGRSDVEPHKHEEPVAEPVKEKSDTIGKIVGMFKRTPAHDDYPASEAYTGPIDETARQGEVEGLPLENHVSVYHSGRSDVEPHKHEEPVVEPVKEKSDKIGKIVGMFKRTPAHEDYPASVAYTGPIDETARQGEVEGLPFEHHVSVYHSGRSDVEPHKHEEPVAEPVKEKSDTIGKIVGMFKRTPAHDDYPASEAYTGPIDETARQGEVEGLPLEHHVSVYHSGRSDVVPHKHEEPVVEPVKEKSDKIDKIVGMFKRTPAHEDYPASVAYTGPIDETARQGEVEGLPLEHHVSVYHSGRSDVVPHKHEEPVAEPVKEKSDTIGKIVGMFKRTPAHEDYPASVAYTGPIDETARQGEVEGLPLEHHVSVYHSGRSDVEPHKHEEPVAEPVKEKSDTIGKIVGMFKRTPAHDDYPASEAYTGPIDETARQGEVEGLPLEHHVSVYHSGRSDVVPHKHEEPVVEPVKEKSDKIDKIVGMFKRTPAHEDYPASEAYTGPIDETARQGEVEGLPLEHHVSVYHSGRSDVEPHKHEEPVAEPVKEKSDTIGKIVGMFKRTPAHEDYPASEAYTGPIDETARQGEVEGLPLEHHVSVYHSGRSDVEPHKHEEPVAEPVKEKKRHNWKDCWHVQENASSRRLPRFRSLHWSN
ncbi:unnamed protein product [Bursaphelenchus okinawaensis]|uniref:Uncharacterized protein n=1 Tax=Bursaphelenchus okinawaensis TaxID=465554 RepID=A0A811JT13_9BILA|nr:unnamed protein product [Bursaphelenchus okinawaensis]CAG9081930.1 unnamed protein product [Bursaphelenchus okinawaensis]